MTKYQFSIESDIILHVSCGDEEGWSFDMVESYGNNLQELLDNATVGRSSDRTGDYLDHWSIGDLKNRLLSPVELEIERLFIIQYNAALAASS